MKNFGKWKNLSLSNKIQIIYLTIGFGVVSGLLGVVFFGNNIPIITVIAFTGAGSILYEILRKIEATEKNKKKNLRRFIKKHFLLFKLKNKKILKVWHDRTISEKLAILIWCAFLGVICGIISWVLFKDVLSLKSLTLPAIISLLSCILLLIGELKDLRKKYE